MGLKVSKHRVDHGEGSFLVAGISGVVDLFTSPKLWTELVVEEIDEGAFLVVLDLERVESLDHHGLGVLAGALAKVRANGGALALARVGETVLDALELARFDEIIPIADTVEEAIAMASGEEPAP